MYPIHDRPEHWSETAYNYWASGRFERDRQWAEGAHEKLGGMYRTFRDSRIKHNQKRADKQLTNMNRKRVRINEPYTSKQDTGGGQLTTTGRLTARSNISNNAVVVGNDGRRWVKNWKDRRPKMEIWWSPLVFMETQNRNFFTLAKTQAANLESLQLMDDGCTLGTVPELMKLLEMGNDTKQVAGGGGAEHFAGPVSMVPDAVDDDANVQLKLPGTLKIPLYQKQMTLKNVSNRRCRLKILEFTAKIDIDADDNNMPTAKWDADDALKATPAAFEALMEGHDWESVNDAGKAAVATTDQFAVRMTLNHQRFRIGAEPTTSGKWGKNMSTYWKLTNTTRTTITGGKTITVISGIDKVQLDLQRLKQANADGVIFLKGYSKIYLVIAYGEMTNDTGTTGRLNGAGDYEIQMMARNQCVFSQIWKTLPTKKVIMTDLGVTGSGIPNAGAVVAAQGGVDQNVGDALPTYAVNL